MRRRLATLLTIIGTLGVGCVVWTQALAGDLTADDLKTKEQELLQQLQKALGQQQQITASVEQLRGAVAVVQQLQQTAAVVPTGAVPVATPEPALPTER